MIGRTRAPARRSLLKVDSSVAGLLALSALFAVTPLPFVAPFSRARSFRLLGFIRAIAFPSQPCDIFPMTKRRKIIATFFASLLVTPFILWSLLPYPIWIYRQAKAQTQYNPKWPVSLEDFKAAKRQVTPELSFFEIIEIVHVESPTTIRFTTLQRWSGPLASAGQEITVDKKGGKWVRRLELGFWWS